MTSCFVYKVMGLTFHDRINTQLIYRFELAKVVARRITKPQRFFLGSRLLFFIQFFLFFGGGGGSDFFILSMSHFFLFIYSLLFFFLFFIPREMAKSICYLLIYRLILP